MSNLVKIGPEFYEKKKFTNDVRQPKAIGHLSFSGDLDKILVIISRCSHNYHVRIS